MFKFNVTVAAGWKRKSLGAFLLATQSETLRNCPAHLSWPKGGRQRSGPPRGTNELHKFSSAQCLQRVISWNSKNPATAASRIVSLSLSLPAKCECYRFESDETDGRNRGTHRGTHRVDSGLPDFFRSSVRLITRARVQIDIDGPRKLRNTSGANTCCL